METEVFAGWHEFFVMTGGAAAALAGLFVVAMSVNIKEILAGPSLTARAAAAIAGLMAILVVAAIGLVPGQADIGVGIELLLVTVALWVFTLAAVRRLVEPNQQVGSAGVRVIRAGLQALVPVPFTIGAVLILVGASGGMAWIAGGVVFVFVLSMLNAWVLLVEILR